MNPDLIKLPSTDPAQILRYRDRQYAAELLAVAVLNLDLFSWLNKNSVARMERICDEFDLAERPADVLLTLCRANGFLTTDDGGKNRLTDLAREYLVKGSPWYLGPYYEPIKDTAIVHGFMEVLRTGKPSSWQGEEEGDDWHKSMLSEDFARHFTELMNCRGLAFGQALAAALNDRLASRSHLLDVGGGSGIYASTLAATNPHLTATVLEQFPVDGIARNEIEEHGLSGRIAVISADMFKDPWPEGADVVLLSNVLHDWDVPAVRTLLKNSYDALPQGGLLVIHEAFINDQKTGPLPVAEYSALLMNITQGKCYSVEEYAALLRELGFELDPYHDTIADRGFVTATKQ